MNIKGVVIGMEVRLSKHSRAPQNHPTYIIHNVDIPTGLVWIAPKGRNVKPQEFPAVRVEPIIINHPQGYFGEKFF